MGKHERISLRAYNLWERVGRPAGHDLTFWLRAERDCTTCALEPGTCPAQTVQGLTGGRHMAICNEENPTCGYLTCSFD
jgi:hypothetical protein